MKRNQLRYAPITSKVMKRNQLRYAPITSKVTGDKLYQSD